MRLHTHALLPWLAIGAVALAGCETGTGVLAPGEQGSGQTRLTVRLTDAPADLAAAWVKVTKVQLVGGDSSATDSTGAAPTRDLEVTDTGWIDLLSLAGGNASTLVSDTVQSGQYAQVRLYVCEMYITTTEGDQIATPGAELPGGVTATPGSELKLTSQCQSGFKVVMRGAGMQLGADSSSTLMIDFDAKHSFAHQAGKSGKWIVTPVLFGTLGSGSGSGGSGSIGGAVALDPAVTTPVDCGGGSLAADALLTAFVPTATLGDTVHTGTATAAGTYTIDGLPPGAYTLGSEAVGFDNGDTLSYTAAATPASVTVVADSASTADFAISAVTCTTP